MIPTRTDWGGTDAGPYQELDCRAELSAAPSDAAQATSIVPRTSGGKRFLPDPRSSTTASSRRADTQQVPLEAPHRRKHRRDVPMQGGMRIAASLPRRPPSYCATKPSFHSADDRAFPSTINKAPRLPKWTISPGREGAWLTTRRREVLPLRP